LLNGLGIDTGIDDADNALCLGCYRTIDEIAQWSRAADETKQAILAAVEKRRNEHDPNGRDSCGDCNR
jgi:predicted Fe-S protein YdhL (DUF1289 family)